MKVDIKDYKSFEQLSEGIKELNEKWKETSTHADKKLTFTGIQKQMQSLYFLFPFMSLLGTNTPSNAIILLHVNIVSLLLQRHV